MSDAMPTHPTGLELRFDRELAAAIPDWRPEFEGTEPAGTPRPARPPTGQRKLPRHRPHCRKVAPPHAD